MDEEYLRKKYKYLYNQVNSIRDEILDIMTFHNDLVDLLKKSIIIDDNIIEDDLLKDTKKLEEDISYEIKDVIMPRISTKI